MLRRAALAAIIALLPSLASAQFATIGPTPPVSDNGDRLATTAWVNGLIGSGLTLASGKIWIGSAGNIATPQTPSGDCTISITGVITCVQAAGNFTVVGNLSVGGAIIDANGILATNIVAPATPGAGTTRIYVDSTQKVLTFKNDAGTVGNAVVPSTCSASQWANTISAAGVIGCAQPGVGNISGFGTGVAAALGINIGSAGAPVLFNGAGGTPSSLTLTNAIGLPLGGLTGAGTGVITALGVNVGTAGSVVVNGGVLGTPSSGVGTNLTALNATQLTSGTVPAARLPTPSASTLGGIQSLTCSANQWLNTISTLGVPSCAQPAFSNLSGSLAQAQVPTGGSSGQVLSTNGSGTGSYVSTKAVLFGASVNTITQGTTGYFTNNACAGSQPVCQIPVPYAGTIKGCTYTSNGAPAAGQTFTFTLMKNGASTTNTAQIVNATPLTNGSAVIADTTHTVSFAANDLFVIQVVVSATAGSTNFSFACEYDAP
jgi:hypothetical protein